MRYQVLKKELQKLKIRYPNRYQELLNEIKEPEKSSFFDSFLSKMPSFEDMMNAQRSLFGSDLPPIRFEVDRYRKMLEMDLEIINERTYGELKISSGSNFEMIIPEDKFDDMSSKLFFNRDKEIHVDLRIKPNTHSLQIAGSYEASRQIWKNNLKTKKQWNTFLNEWKNHSSYTEIIQYSNRLVCQILKEVLKRRPINHFELGIRIRNHSIRFTQELRNSLFSPQTKSNEKMINSGKLCYMFPLDNLVRDLTIIFDKLEYPDFNRISQEMNQVTKISSLDEISNQEPDDFVPDLFYSDVFPWIASFVVSKLIITGVK